MTKTSCPPVRTATDDELIAFLCGNRRGNHTNRVSDAMCSGPSILDIAQHDERALRLHFGFTPAAAKRVAAALELAKRLVVARRPDRPSLRTPEQVAHYMAIHGGDAVESFWCLPIDSRSRAICQPIQVTRGDVDGTDAGPRAFFRGALVAGAVSAIAVHNHPTGDPSPSPADRVVTKRLVDAGRNIDVPLIDHLVLGDGGRFTSLRRDMPSLFAS